MREFFLLTLLLISTESAAAQTLYTVVLGNQKYVVGSSTLRSGLFVSYDGAGTWKHVGPENLKAYSMDAVDTSNGRILYIAAGNGVHRSTDYGRSWKIVTDWRMTEVMDLKVDQNNPDYVYAATAFGFWRSTDGGETWENPEGELKEEYCYRITDLRGDSISLLTGSRDFASPMKQITVGVNPSGIVFSPPPQVMPRQMTIKYGHSNCHYYYPATGGCGYIQYDTLLFLSIAIPCSLIDSAFTSIPWLDGVYAGFPHVVKRFHCGDNPGVDSIIHVTGSETVSTPFSSPIHALVRIDAHRHVDHLLAGTFGDGLYTWDGKEWKFTGLPGAQIWRIVRKDYRVPVEVGHEH